MRHHIFFGRIILLLIDKLIISCGLNSWPSISDNPTATLPSLRRAVEKDRSIVTEASREKCTQKRPTVCAATWAKHFCSVTRIFHAATSTRKKFDTQNKWISECIRTFSASNPFTRWTRVAQLQMLGQWSNWESPWSNVDHIKYTPSILFANEKFAPHSNLLAFIIGRRMDQDLCDLLMLPHKIINYRFFSTLSISLAGGSSYANGIISIFIYLATLWFCTLRCDETMTANLFTTKKNRTTTN